MQKICKIQRSKKLSDIYCNYLYLGNTFCNKRASKEFKINYNLDCNSCNVVNLINCKKCQVQYVGSTITKFWTRFNSHKNRINTHKGLTKSQNKKDEFVYRHFNIAAHGGLEDKSIQLTDFVKREKELREKEGH